MSHHVTRQQQDTFRDLLPMTRDTLHRKLVRK